MLVFPAQGGRFFEFEDFGMIHTIHPFIDAGKVQVYTVDSVDNQSWANLNAHPADRARRHEDYDRYIMAEVAPFIRSHSPSGAGKFLSTGVSMGAYHAVNFFLRHPNLFSGTIALSGLYRLDRNEFGNTAADLSSVYFNSPVSYLPGLEDPWYLNLYHNSTIIICVGQGDWEEEAVEDTRAMDSIFRAC